MSKKKKKVLSQNFLICGAFLGSSRIVFFASIPFSGILLYHGGLTNILACWLVLLIVVKALLYRNGVLVLNDVIRLLY